MSGEIDGAIELAEYMTNLMGMIETEKSYIQKRFCILQPDKELHDRTTEREIAHIKNILDQYTDTISHIEKQVNNNFSDLQVIKHKSRKLNAMFGEFKCSMERYLENKQPLDEEPSDV